MRTCILLFIVIITCSLSWSRAGTKTEPSKPSASDTGQRFVDHETYIEDTQTGLLWQKDGAVSQRKTFQQAQAYAAQLELGGLKEWRVPTRAELKAIFPAIEAPFKNTKYTEHQCCGGGREYPKYWTADIDHRLPSYAYIYQWYADGGANNCYMSNQGYVRAVHDPKK